MTIYKLWSDSDNYATLSEDPMFDIDETRSFDGRSKKNGWKPLTLVIDNPKEKLPLGDFTYNVTDILSVEALDKLKGLIENDVEILPVKFSEREYVAINITTVLNVIDYEKSDYLLFPDNKRIMLFNKYVFRQCDELIEHNIFRLVDEKIRRPFVTDKFKEIVEQNGLTGFRFELVWDSEDPSAGDKKPISHNLQEEAENSADNDDEEPDENSIEYLQWLLRKEVPKGQEYSERPVPEIKKTVLRYRDEKNDKFWQCECLGTQLMVNSGKWGANGRYSVKEYSTEEECAKQAEKQINAKLNKGYVYTEEFEEKGHKYFDDPDAGASRLTSHPVFRRYCSDDLYYDIGNDLAPFGNDTGNDIMWFTEEKLHKFDRIGGGNIVDTVMRWKLHMPYIFPKLSEDITDEELLATAKSDIDGMNGADVMFITDRVMIAGVLAHFKVNGFLERMQMFQLFRSLDRYERLARLIYDDPPEELFENIAKIRNDIYCYDIDRYSDQYYSIVTELGTTGVFQYEEWGRATFGIPKDLNGRALAERVYEITEELLSKETLPKKFDNIYKIYRELGCLFGSAICHEYGWHWMEAGEPSPYCPLDDGFDTMPQFHVVVPPNDMYSFAPISLIESILEQRNTGLGGENDNTVMLLFNMLPDIDKHIKNTKIKYLPVS